MEAKRLIVNGKTALGIELGSTRIKGVLIDFKARFLQLGSITGKILLLTISGHTAWRRFIREYAGATTPCGKMWKENTAFPCRISVLLESAP